MKTNLVWMRTFILLVSLLALTSSALAGVQVSIPQNPVEALTYNGATVTWTTSDPVSGQVRVGLTPGGPRSTIFDETGGPTTSHSVPLTGLTQNTWHYFTIVSYNSTAVEVINISSGQPNAVQNPSLCASFPQLYRCDPLVDPQDADICSFPQPGFVSCVGYSACSDCLFRTTIAPDLDAPEVVANSISILFPTSTQAQVSWQTTEDSETLLYFGNIQNDYTLYRTTLQSTSHSVTVPLADPETLHFYIIGTRDTIGNTWNDSQRSFNPSQDQRAQFIEADIPAYHNRRELQVEGRTKLGSFVRVSVNGVLLSQTTTEDGMFALGAELGLETNTLTIESTDQQQNKVTETYTVSLDLNPPTLEVSPLPEFSARSQITINGSVSEFVNLSIEVATVDDTTPPVKVTGLTTGDIGTNSAELSWDEIADALEYAIYRDGVRITSVSSTQFTDFGIDSGSTYEYRVSAVDESCNEGQQSDPLSVETVSGGVSFGIQPNASELGCSEHVSTDYIGVQGLFTHEITLAEGENRITVTARDRGGNEQVREFTVFFGTGGPEILETNLQEFSGGTTADGFFVTDRFITVRGRVAPSPFGSITIEGYVNDGLQNRVQTDENGFFEMELELRRDIVVEDVTTPEEESGSEQGVGIQFGSAESWANKVKLVARDPLNNTDEVEEDVILARCNFGGWWDVDLGSPAPNILTPGLILDGTEVVGFSVDLTWQASGPAGTILRAPTVEKRPLSIQEAQQWDANWAGTPRNVWDPVNRTTGYIELNFQTPYSYPENMTKIEREQNITRQGGDRCLEAGLLGEAGISDVFGCLQVPLMLTVEFQDADGNARTQRQCFSLDLQTQGRPDPDIAPTFLLNWTVLALSELIDAAEQVREPLQKANEITTIACVGSWGVAFVHDFLSNLFTCDTGILAQFAGKGFDKSVAQTGTCDIVYTGDDPDVSQIRTACNSCSGAIKTSRDLWEYSDWICGRVACPAAPTLTKYIQDSKSGRTESKTSVDVSSLNIPVDPTGLVSGTFDSFEIDQNLDCAAAQVQPTYFGKYGIKNLYYAFKGEDELRENGEGILDGENAIDDFSPGYKQAKEAALAAGKQEPSFEDYCRGLHESDPACCGFEYMREHDAACGVGGFGLPPGILFDEIEQSACLSAQAAGEQGELENCEDTFNSAAGFCEPDGAPPAAQPIATSLRYTGEASEEGVKKLDPVAPEICRLDTEDYPAGNNRWGIHYNRLPSELQDLLLTQTHLVLEQQGTDTGNAIDQGAPIVVAYEESFAGNVAQGHTLAEVSSWQFTTPAGVNAVRAAIKRKLASADASAIECETTAPTVVEGGLQITKAEIIGGQATIEWQISEGQTPDKFELSFLTESSVELPGEKFTILDASQRSFSGELADTSHADQIAKVRLVLTLTPSTEQVTTITEEITFGDCRDDSHCSGGTPRCLEPENRCVECLENDECGFGFACGDDHTCFEEPYIQILSVQFTPRVGDVEELSLEWETGGGIEDPVFVTVCSETGFGCIPLESIAGEQLENIQVFGNIFTVGIDATHLSVNFPVTVQVYAADEDILAGVSLEDESDLFTVAVVGIDSIVGNVVAPLANNVRGSADIWDDALTGAVTGIADGDVVTGTGTTDADTPGRRRNVGATCTAPENGEPYVFAVDSERQVYFAVEPAPEGDGFEVWRGIVATRETAQFNGETRDGSREVEINKGLTFIKIEEVTSFFTAIERPSGSSGTAEPSEGDSSGDGGDASAEATSGAETGTPSTPDVVSPRESGLCYNQATGKYYSDGFRHYMIERARSDQCFEGFAEDNLQNVGTRPGADCAETGGYNTEDPFIQKVDTIYNNIRNTIGIDDKPYIVEPTSSLLRSVQCACVPAVHEYVATYSNVMQGLRNCFQAIMLTGDGVPGQCEELLSTYVCEFAFDLISCFVDKFGGASISEEEIKPGIDLGNIFKSFNDAGSRASERVRGKYGQTALFEGLFGEDQLVHSICLFAFTGTWGLDFGALVEGSTFVPIEPVVLGPAPCERKFNGWDPISKEVKWRYDVGLSIAGNGAMEYGVDLVCSNDASCDPNDGFQNGWCDCRNFQQPPHSLETGQISRDDPGILFGGDERGQVSGTISSPVRYDKAVLWVAFTDNNGDQQRREHTCDINQVGGPPPSVCQFDFAGGQGFTCEVFPNERNFIKFETNPALPFGVNGYGVGETMRFDVATRQVIPPTDCHNTICEYTKFLVIDIKNQNGFSVWSNLENPILYDEQGRIDRTHATTQLEKRFFEQTDFGGGSAIRAELLTTAGSSEVNIIGWSEVVGTPNDNAFYVRFYDDNNHFKFFTTLQQAEEQSTIASAQGSGEYYSSADQAGAAGFVEHDAISGSYKIHFETIDGGIPTPGIYKLTPRQARSTQIEGCSSGVDFTATFTMYDSVQNGGLYDIGTVPSVDDLGRPVSYTLPFRATCGGLESTPVGGVCEQPGTNPYSRFPTYQNAAGQNVGCYCDEPFIGEFNCGDFLTGYAPTVSQSQRTTATSDDRGSYCGRTGCSPVRPCRSTVGFSSAQTVSSGLSEDEWADPYTQKDGEPTCACGGFTGDNLCGADQFCYPANDAWSCHDESPGDIDPPEVRALDLLAEEDNVYQLSTAETDFYPSSDPYWQTRKLKALEESIVIHVSAGDNENLTNANITFTQARGDTPFAGIEVDLLGVKRHLASQSVPEDTWFELTGARQTEFVNIQPASAAFEAKLLSVQRLSGADFILMDLRVEPVFNIPRFFISVVVKDGRLGLKSDPFFSGQLNVESEIPQVSEFQRGIEPVVTQLQGPTSTVPIVRRGALYVKARVTDNNKVEDVTIDIYNRDNRNDKLLFFKLNTDRYLQESRSGVLETEDNVPLVRTGPGWVEGSSSNLIVGDDINAFIYGPRDPTTDTKGYTFMVRIDSVPERYQRQLIINVSASDSIGNTGSVQTVPIDTTQGDPLLLRAFGVSVPDRFDFVEPTSIGNPASRNIYVGDDFTLRFTSESTTSTQVPARLRVRLTNKASYSPQLTTGSYTWVENGDFLEYSCTADPCIAELGLSTPADGQDLRVRYEAVDSLGNTWHYPAQTANPVILPIRSRYLASGWKMISRQSFDPDEAIDPTVIMVSNNKITGLNYRIVEDGAPSTLANTHFFVNSVAGALPDFWHDEPTATFGSVTEYGLSEDLEKFAYSYEVSLDSATIDRFDKKVISGSSVPPTSYQLLITPTFEGGITGNTVTISFERQNVRDPTEKAQYFLIYGSASGESSPRTDLGNIVETSFSGTPDITNPQRYKHPGDLRRSTKQLSNFWQDDIDDEYWIDVSGSTWIIKRKQIGWWDEECFSINGRTVTHTDTDDSCKALANALNSATGTPFTGDKLNDFQIPAGVNAQTLSTMAGECYGKNSYAEAEAEPTCFLRIK